MRPFTIYSCVAAGLLAASGTIAAAAKADTDRIAAAAEVVRELHAAPDKAIPRQLWDRAQCVASIPGLKKAALIVGGEYGKGLVSCRTAAGWSAPAFLTIEKGSWGAQIGGESVDLVLLVMNDRGVAHLLQDKVALGGDASIAAGPVGRDAQAATDAQLHAEILSYSRARGLFAGIDLSGGVIRPDEHANRDLYGRSVTVQDILRGHNIHAPAQARVFLRALSGSGTTSTRAR